MDSPASSPVQPANRSPALTAFAAAAAAWAFVPVTLGAFTTSINAGMAFPDWPLSDGSLNPHGWLTNLAMFAEHSHRLTVGLLSILTIALAAWIGLTERRAWLRRLGWFAVALVLAQAVVGGLRVLLDPDRVPSLDTNVGQLLAMLHACLAQFFLCTLIAVATACTGSWIRQPVLVRSRLRRTGVVCCALLFVQLAIAAVMRHSFAGLAIPTFPWSTPDGRILPAAWDFRVAINFAHRAMALVVSVALVVFAFRLWFDPGAWLRMRCGASLMISLLALQVLLGAAIIRTGRDPLITTAHVVVGALTLATTFWLTWLAYRDALETPAAS